MWFVSLVLMTKVYLLASQRVELTSPCPSVFSYEERSPESDRWYGVVLVTTDSPLTGLRLDIELSDPALLMGNWEGEVTTTDNKRFIILNLDKKVVPGPPISIRIFVRFSERKSIPVVQQINLNGRQICPQQHGGTYQKPPYVTSDSNAVWRPTSLEANLQAEPLVIDDDYQKDILEPEDDRVTRRPSNSRPGGSGYQNTNYQSQAPSRRPGGIQTPSSGGYEDDEFSDRQSTRRPSIADDRDRFGNQSPSRQPSGNYDSNQGSQTPSRRPSEGHKNGYQNPSSNRRPVDNYDNEEFESQSPPRKPSNNYGNDFQTSPTRRPSDVYDNVDQYDGPKRPSGSQGNDFQDSATRRPSNNYDNVNREDDPRRPSGGQGSDFQTSPTRRPNDGYDNTDQNGGPRRPSGSQANNFQTSTTRRPNDGYDNIDQDGGPRRPSVSQGNSFQSPQTTRRPNPSGNYGNNNDNAPQGNKKKQTTTTTRRPVYPADNIQRPVPTTRRPTTLNAAPSFEGNRPNKRPRPPDREELLTEPPARPPPQRITAATRRPDREELPMGLEDGEAEECGRQHISATPLVTHGQSTARGQWPWHAAIYKAKGINLTYICGGTLVSPTAVVTAAHCVTKMIGSWPVDADNLVVYLGKYHLKLWSEGGVQNRQVVKVHVHPQYNSSDFQSDVAVLVLSSPADYTQYVRPVCLWGADNEDLRDVEGRMGYVVGWGYDEESHVTEQLMVAQMPIVSQQTCLWSYPEFFSHFTNNRTYCAGFNNGTSVCNGDSGGGMVLPEEQRDGSKVWRLRGLVSISVSKEEKRVCDTEHYVVFTDLAKYQHWIRQVIS